MIGFLSLADGGLSESQLLAVGAGVLVVYVVIVLAIAIVTIVAAWKVYAKAGEPGWASLIPFYNTYVLFKISWGKGWLFLLPTILGCAGAGIMTAYDTESGAGGVFLALGCILYLAAAVVSIITLFKLAKSFGQGVGFGFGLLFLNFIFMCILAFGSARYVGPNGVPAAFCAPNGMPTAPYAPNGAPYNQNGAPYNQNGAPYNQNGAPYNQNGSGPAAQ